MKVRDATIDDATEIREVASAAWRDTYRDALAPATIDAFLAAAYSEDMLRRRIERHTFLVVEHADRLIAFANAVAEPDRLNLASIYASPEWRGRGAGTLLLEALRARFPELPVFADVLAGNEKGETFYERRGFAPREVLDVELFGEPVRERRWWLGPLRTKGS